MAHNNNIEELSKIFKNFIDMPYKTSEDIKKQEEIRIALDKALNDETIELVNELNLIGLNINSIWDLVNTKKSYPDAIPILIEHLSKDYSDRNKEGIIRALAVKEAKGKVVSILIELYNKIPKEKQLLRWAIGNTICTVITKGEVESIIPIVQDETNGASRQMFVLALGKFKNDKIINILKEHSKESDIALQVTKALN